MWKKDKVAWLISFSIGFFLIVFSFLFPWLAVRNRFDSNQPDRDIFMPLRPGKNLSQTFTANHNLINIVILCFKNPGLANKSEFKFLLKSSEGKNLVEKTFSGFNTGDPSDIRFQFEPIADSKGKVFTIEVSTFSPEEPLLSMGTDGQKGLSYAVYYRTMNKKLAFLDLLESFSLRFFSDVTFSIFWLFSLIFLLIIRAINFSK